MNSPLARLILIALLLLTVVSPFAGLAPLMLILLGFGVFWFLGSLVQALFRTDVEGDDNKAGLKSSRGES